MKYILGVTLVSGGNRNDVVIASELLLSTRVGFKCEERKSSPLKRLPGESLNPPEDVQLPPP